MPALTTSTASVVYDVYDVKIYPLLTDVAGASPTYGAGCDVPGSAELGADPNLVTATLKGDSRIIAKKGRTDHYAISLKWGKHSLAAMANILGGLTAQTGTTPNTKAGFRSMSPAPLPYFRVDCLMTDLDIGIGDLWIIFYKCQLTGGSLIATSSDNFSQPNIKADAIAVEGHVNKLFTGGTDDFVMCDFIYRETSVDLTLTALPPA